MSLVIAWLALSALGGAALSALKGRQRLAAGRDMLAARGMSDYRYTTGEHAGRWASEALVDDLDRAEQSRVLNGG